MIYRLVAILGKQLQKNENLDLAPKAQALPGQESLLWNISLQGKNHPLHL